jgi:phage antirepressor YoqD-like protein/phage anti-repressor protein
VLSRLVLPGWRGPKRPHQWAESYTVDLIQIHSQIIGEETVQTVNARDLYTFLGVVTDFSTWMARRIIDYGFIDGRDFSPFVKESSGGRPANEYAITIGMAKELAMVERNDKGRQVRLYFIECERRSKTAAIELPNFADPVAAARAWADATEQKQIAQQSLLLAAPKVEFVDRYVEATGTQTFRQVAKLLQAKEPAFRAFLAARRILYQIGGAWTPYAEHIDAGRFVVKTGSADNGHAFSATRFTPKGIAWVSGLWLDAIGGAA